MFRNKTYIILTTILLVCSIFGAVYLIKQSQDSRRQADAPSCPAGTHYVTTINPCCGCQMSKTETVCEYDNNPGQYNNISGPCVLDRGYCFDTCSGSGNCTGDNWYCQRNQCPADHVFSDVDCLNNGDCCCIKVGGGPGPTGGGEPGGECNPPSCDPNQLNMSVSSSSIRQGQIVTFSLSGNQGSTHVNDTFSGGVNCPGFNIAWPVSQTCTTTTPGTHTWTHTWRNCACDFDHCSSTTCSKSVTFTVTANPTNTPVPTNTPIPTTPPSSINWTINSKIFCPTGTTLTGKTRNFYAYWPPNPLTWKYNDFSVGDKTLTLTLLSNSSSNVYLGMETEKEVALHFYNTSPHTEMHFGTYFNPPTYMAQWNKNLPPTTYNITFLGNEEVCTSPSATNTPTPPIPTTDKCKAKGGYCISQGACDGTSTGRETCPSGQICCVVSSNPTDTPTSTPRPTNTPTLTPTNTPRPTSTLTPTTPPRANATPTITCDNNLASYAIPDPARPNSAISFIFTSNQKYTNVSFYSGPGSHNCTLDIEHSDRCSGNIANDSRSCWWKWDCVSQYNTGSFTGTFTNSEKCSKDIVYRISTSLDIPTNTPFPTLRPTSIKPSSSQSTPTATPTQIVLPQSGIDFPFTTLTILGVIISLVGFLILL